MTTLTIHIPDSKADFIKKLLKELDVKIESVESVESVESAKTKKENRVPNKETIKAIEDARRGKTTRITDFKAFFEKI
ncbi:MAG: hypothetical protein ACO1N4_11680 [Pedobacter sp.]